MLILISARIVWLALISQSDPMAAQKVIEAVGLLAAAVVALQIAETIAEKLEPDAMDEAKREGKKLE